MPSTSPRVSRAQWALMVACGGLCVLLFGGLLSYYGDDHVREYRWKGPVGAIVIVTVCVAAVLALQRLVLNSWVRGLGYLAVVLAGSALAFQASATYYGERCDDPGYFGQCGLPLLTAMLWSAVAAVSITALVLGTEIVRRSRSRRVADGDVRAAAQAGSRQSG